MWQIDCKYMSKFSTATLTFGYFILSPARCMASRSQSTVLYHHLMKLLPDCQVLNLLKLLDCHRVDCHSRYYDTIGPVKPKKASHHPSIQICFFADLSTVTFAMED